MTLPHITAAAVAAGMIIDRADTPDELETLWKLNDCDGYTGRSREYLAQVRKSVEARHARNAEALRMAGAV